MSTEIVDKIRALLRKTTERGASQAEMETAMEMAQKLMTKYNIDKITVDSAEAEEMRRKEPDVRQVYHHTKRQRYETDQYIARILRRCFSVRVLWSSEYEHVDSYEWTHTNPATGKYEEDEHGNYKKFKRTTDYRGNPIRVMKERLSYLLVGEQMDCDVAKMIVEELHPMMRQSFARYLKENGFKWNAVLCHSFYEGIEDGYIQANERGRDSAMREAGKEKADKYAIVLVDKDKAINAFVKEKIMTVPSRVGYGARSGGHDDHAYGKGKQIGSKMKLGQTKLSGRSKSGKALK
jgi:hypothetical protein